MDSLRKHSKGARSFYGRATELEAELHRWAPFVSSHPCGCGSKNRVWNKRGRVFCMKCGKQHDAPR